MRNKKIVITVTSIVAVLLVIIGVTYAYWLVTKTQTNQNVISSGCLDISLTGEKNDIELTNQFPLSDEDGMKLTPYEFTVTNNCSTSVDYQVNLESIGDSSNTIKASAIKVALNDEIKLLNDGGNVEPTISGAYESNRILFGTLASKGETEATKTYNLRIWIDENAPISEQNKTYRAKISVTIGQGIINPYKEGTLAYSILSNYGGLSAITEMDNPEFDHRVIGVGTVDFINSNVYYGTEFKYDKETGKYTLSGEIIQANPNECRNGTKVCGKYTLNSNDANYSGGYIYEIVNWGRLIGNYDYREAESIDSVVNEVGYIRLADSITSPNEKSLYKAEDDLGTSYYFRGAPTNNYVKFGNHTEAMTDEYSSYVSKYTYSYEWPEIYYGYDACDANGDNCTGASGFESLAECEADLERIGYPSGQCSSYEEWQYDSGHFDTLEACEDAIASKGYSTSCWEYLDGTTSKQIESSDMYWRIVRINGDGTIRLVYDGIKAFENGVGHNVAITNSFYGAVSSYWYASRDANGNKQDSVIKTTLEDWYSNTLEKEYGKYITDNIFCYDNSVGYGSDYVTVDAAMKSFKCSSKNNKYTMSENFGNGLLNKPIGLLTTKEILFAGGIVSSEFFSSNMYLNSASSPFYTFDVNWFGGGFGIYSEGDSQELGVRPVINLKADVKFTGKGTIDSPYEIVVN